MNEIKRNSGYDYIMSLCSAIETFCDGEEKRRGGTFIYQGANLRRAAEMALYRSLYESKSLFQSFALWQSGNLPASISLPSTIEKELFCSMTGISEEKVTIKSQRSIKSRMKPALSALLRGAGIGHLAKAVRQSYNACLQKKPGQAALFYVSNDRFVKYAKPLGVALGSPTSFITHNPGTLRYLKRSHVPHIDLAMRGYCIERWTQKGSLLKDLGLIERFDILSDSIRRTRPRTVVVIEGNASQDEIVNQICKKEHIPCICIQQGWSPVIHTGFRKMSYSKMLVWGDGFADLLAPYNPDQRFITTGSHMLEANAKPAREDIKTITFFFQATTRLLDEKSWQEFVHLAIAVAEDHKDLTVAVREHPARPLRAQDKQALAAMQNVRFMNSDKYSIDAVMQETDLSVSVYSTTILESIAAGIVPVICNVTSLPRYCPDIAQALAGIEAESVEEARAAINSFLKSPGALKTHRKAMEAFKSNFFSGNKEIALRNIITEIGSV